MMQSSILRPLLVVGLLLALAVSAKAMPSVPAPNFRLTTLAGQPVTKESLQGKPTLLMFWASWCETCQAELPHLTTLYEQKKEKGLQAVAIGFRDEESNIRGYVQAHRGTFIFPTAYDVNDRVSESFGARATPTFVLLDAHGRVVLLHVGGGFLQDPAFKKFIQEL
jgi:thiol-disulfide isomerase/thioredoxin